MNSKFLFVILLTVVLPYSSLEAQYINKTFIPEKTLFTRGDVLEPVGNGQWLIGGAMGLLASSYGEVHPYIAMISETGELIWEHTFFQPYYGSTSGGIHQIIPFEDGTFQILGRYETDFFSATYDTLGQQLDMHRFSGSGNVARHLPNGDVIFSSKGGKYVRRTSIDGQQIWDVDLSDYVEGFRFIQFCVSTEGEIYVLGENKLIQLDAQNGMMTAEVDILNSQSLLFLPDSNVLAVLATENVLRLDKELHLLDTTHIGKAGYSHYRIKAQNDRVYIFAKEEDGGNTVVDEFDLDFDPLQSFQIANNFQIVQDIGVQNGQFLVLGNKVFEATHEIDLAQYLYSTKFHLITNMYVQTLDSSQQFYPNNLDVALLNIELITPIVIPEFQYPCANSQLDSVRLWIFNQGEDTIRSLTIGWKEHNCYYDWNVNYSSTLSDLNLAPGTNQMIAVGILANLGGLNNNDEVELCFFAMGPNGQIDKTPENDVYCKWLSNSELTAVDDLEEGVSVHSTRGLNVFPNPVHSHLSIASSQAFKKDSVAQIFDASGKLVQSHRLAVTLKESKIDVQNLLPGIYFLRVGEKAGRFVKY